MAANRYIVERNSVFTNRAYAYGGSARVFDTVEARFYIVNVLPFEPFDVSVAVLFDSRGSRQLNPFGPRGTAVLAAALFSAPAVDKVSASA